MAVLFLVSMNMIAMSVRLPMFMLVSTKSIAMTVTLAMLFSGEHENDRDV